MRRFAFLIALLLPLALAPVPVEAQVSGLRGGDQPMQIRADQGIEWRRDQQVYIARGNASVTRGGVTFSANVLTARYRESADGSSEIYRVEADGDVNIVSDSETVYGDIGVYDVDKGVLVLRGDNLQMVTARETITAQESLEYWEDVEGSPLAVARGGASARRDDYLIQADILTASFGQQTEPSDEVTQIDAIGAVKVTTSEEVATAVYGVFYVDPQLATLSCDVAVIRGQNTLNGQYAEINLNTGVSRLLPNPVDCGGSNRVHGLFVPRSVTQ
jgi:lipopolysaccharide export system protein LptA